MWSMWWKYWCQRELCTANYKSHVSETLYQTSWPIRLSWLVACDNWTRNFTTSSLWGGHTLSLKLAVLYSVPYKECWELFLNFWQRFTYHQKTLPEVVTAQVMKEEIERWATPSPSSSGNSCALWVRVCTRDGGVAPGIAKEGGKKRLAD